MGVRSSENLLLYNVNVVVSVWHLAVEFQAVEFLSPLAMRGFLGGIKFCLKARLQDHPVRKLKHTDIIPLKI